MHSQLTAAMFPPPLPLCDAGGNAGGGWPRGECAHVAPRLASRCRYVAAQAYEKLLPHAAPTFGNAHGTVGVHTKRPSCAPARVGRGQ